MSNAELLLADTSRDMRFSKTAKNTPMPMMSALYVGERIASIFSIILVMCILISGKLDILSILTFARKGNHLNRFAFVAKTTNALSLNTTTRSL
ncbi:MAG: hypothetical protein HZC40_18050 [Chloroflexi bacterium]|nr:hypothetical protein [Chloroflexota bacterium]